MREKHPKLFFSQFSNKFIYSQMGAVDLLKGSNEPLCKIIEMKIDGRVISLD